MLKTIDFIKVYFVLVVFLIEGNIKLKIKNLRGVPWKDII